MKLCYIVHDQEGLFYRYKQYIPFFKKKNDDLSIIPLKSGFFSRLKGLWEASSSEIVIVRRKLLQPWESMLLKLWSCKVVFDFDDAILFKSSPPYDSLGRKIKFATIMKSSDVIIAGNSYLKELAGKFTAPSKIHILPTPIDLSKYKKKDYSIKSDNITLGWIGSRSTLKYLKELIPVFNKLGEKYKNLELKIVGNAFFDCKGLKVTKKEWNYDKEVDDLLSFDVGLMPLDDTPWSRGKCSFKLIQYVAVGIPGVCSPVGMNADVIENEKNGLWATSLEEWENQLSKLIEDPVLREQMGLAAYEKAYAYDQKHVFEKFYKILSDTLESK
jgi:glycosyltransferase involved in cell wall biosynthesis